MGAEEALKKAAKLNPTLEGAWICLGQLLWKKGNLDGAKNCYAAVTSRAPNKKASQCMSMLCRTIAKAKAAPGTDEQKEHVVESLKHAKAAIKLDVTDGYSWYQCGMAYMTQFFAEGATDPNKLSQSLQCFASAEKGGPRGREPREGRRATTRPSLQSSHRAAIRGGVRFGARGIQARGAVGPAAAVEGRG